MNPVLGTDDVKWDEESNYTWCEKWRESRHWNQGMEREYFWELRKAKIAVNRICFLQKPFQKMIHKYIANKSKV